MFGRDLTHRLMANLKTYYVFTHFRIHIGAYLRRYEYASPAPLMCLSVSTSDQESEK